MSKPSNWQLDNNSVRRVAPAIMGEALRNHALTSDCYPLAVGIYQNARGHAMRRTQHDDNLLIYCFGGKGTLKTKSWQGDISTGQLLLLPSGVSHEYRADKDEPWSIYWCHFSGGLASDYMNTLDYSTTNPVKQLAEPQALMSIFKTLLAATNHGTDELAMIHAANTLRSSLSQIALTLREGERHADRFDTEAIQAYMQANLSKNIQLDELAAMASLSKFHFCKAYKRATGLTPIAHLMDMKLTYAKYLLETSSLNVQQIAYRIGYDDGLYFSRMFKKATKVSPRSYRQSHNN